MEKLTLNTAPQNNARDRPMDEVKNEQEQNSGFRRNFTVQSRAGVQHSRNSSDNNTI
jgi:hypothetical protein